MKKYLRILIAPVCLLLLVLLIGVVWKVLNLPPEEELISLIKVFFEKYGVGVVLVSAILESGFVVGIYAPGGLVIFLGVIFSIGNPWQAVWVVASAVLGFLIGYSIDFFLGKYGWYRFLVHIGLGNSIEKTKERIKRYGISTAWIGYHDPNLGSLVSTAYGTLQYSYTTFLMNTFLPVLMWCTFWGIIAYTFGNDALTLMGYETLFIIIGVWIIARVIEVRFFEESTLKKRSARPHD